MGDISNYAWIAWVVVILLFVSIEMLTLELTFLSLAIGSVGGLVSGLLGAPWWLQILLTAVIAIVLLAFIRPPLLRLLRRGADPARSNVDALIGIEGTVVASVGENGGQVKLGNGETWTARLSPVTVPRVVAAGERVLVTAIDGATAVIVPTERIVE